jgi:metal-sulfur cluster biosynthetic enzyme
MARFEYMNIFGHKIELGKVDYIMTKGILKYFENGDGSIKIAFTATKDCPMAAYYEKYYKKAIKQIPSEGGEV